MFDKRLILLILMLNFVGLNLFAQEKQLFSIGVIDGLHSKILNETRILNIYLPRGYDPKDTVLYPVIYLLDGSSDEDFIHVAGIVQYYSFEWINIVPKSIVVGIANTDRPRDFTFPTRVAKEKERHPAAGQSRQFMAFLEQELQPYIRQSYKTSDRKTLIGQSLGGLFAAEVLLTRPGLFDHYFIISPSLWWDDGSLLNAGDAALKSDAAHEKFIYVAVGKEGLAPSEKPHVMEVDANLLVAKITAAGSEKLKVAFEYLPDETHATIAHQAIMNAFKLLHKSKG